MNVLLVNQYFPPDTSATASVFSDMVAAFKDAGHVVTVLCGRPSYEPLERRPWRPWFTERHDGTPVHRVGSTALSRHNPIGRIVNYLTFLVMGALRVFGLPKPDVVVVGTDPPLAISLALRAARDQPVVYSLQDLHPDAAIAAGWLKKGSLARLWDRVHTSGLRRASLIVCLSDAMRDRVQTKGVLPERLAVVANGSADPIGELDEHVVREIRGDRDFVVLHAGNIGTMGAWETIISAAMEVDERAGFVFVGDGARAHRVKAAGLPVIPFKPLSQFPSVMAAGDMQLVTQRPGTEDLVVPSKLYSVLSHGRPVFAVAPPRSEASRVIAEWSCGLWADPSDPDDVRAKIEWARLHPEELRDMATNALAASQHFERAQCMRRFVSLATSEVTRGAR